MLLPYLQGEIVENKNLHILRLSIFILIASVILVLSLVPRPPEVIKVFSFSDKIEHFAAYIALSLSFAFLIFSCNLRKTAVFAVLFSSLYGGVIEVLQGFTGRSPEFLDLLSDTAGAVTGTLIYFLLRRKSCIKLHQQPLK